MRKKFLSLLAVGALTAFGAMAQTDLADTYITNADFSSTEGWTSYKGGGTEVNTEMGLIGTLTINNVKSTTDATHTVDMNCAGVSARWNGRYAAWQQTTGELPAGKYTLSFDVENPGNSNSYNMGNLTYVQVGETTFNDEGMTAAKLKGATGWVNHTITFTVPETQTITISLGYKNNENKGSADTPELFFSNLQLFNALELAINNLNAEIAAAQTQLATYAEGTAWYTSLTAAIATAKTADNTDEEAINAAIAALQQAEADAATLYAQAKNVEDFNNYRTNYNETVELGNWTISGTSQNNKGQHWSGNGDATYLEPNQWNNNSVSWSGTQEVTLPAGQYVLMATGRSAAETTLTLAVLDGASVTNSVEFPKKGDSGFGVDVEGNANFAAEGAYANGVGRGWEWRYVPFILEEGKTVKFKFEAKSSATHQWASITAFELRAIPAAITYPTDMTYMISSPSFEDGKGNWTWNTADDTGIKDNSDGTYTIDNCNGSKLFNTWGGSAVKYVEQEIVGLPEGIYTLTAAIASDAGNHVTLYAGQSSKDCVMVADKGHADDFYVECVLPEDGVLKIGAKSTDWYKVDNFRLELTRAATAEDLATLLTQADVDALKAQAAAIEAAHVLGFMEDEYAPYNNIEALDAVAAAKVFSVAGNTKAEYLAVKAALEDAVWTANTEEVNAVYNGNGFTGAHAGWNGGEIWAVEEGAENYDALGALVDNEGTRNVLYLRWDNASGAWYNYGTTEGYPMPLKAGVTYTFSCDFAAWGVAGNPNVVLYDLTNAVNIGSEKSFNGKRIDDGGIIYTHATFEFTPEKAGNVRLSFYMPGDANKGNLVISNVSITTTPDTKAAGFYAHNVVLSEETGYNNNVAYTAEKVSLTRTYTTGDNWSTFCAPFAIATTDLGSNAKAAQLTGATEDALEFTLVNELEAGKPYIVRYVDEAGIIANNVDVVAEAGSFTGGNFEMKGEFALTTISGNEYFIKNNAFHIANVNVTVKPFRAYIVDKTPAPAGKPAMRVVVDGEESGIATIVGDELMIEDGDMYNVMGQKVDSNYKGLVIKNGQKFINK